MLNQTYLDVSPHHFLLLLLCLYTLQHEVFVYIYHELFGHMLFDKKMNILKLLELTLLLPYLLPLLKHVVPLLLHQKIYLEIPLQNLLTLFHLSLLLLLPLSCHFSLQVLQAHLQKFLNNHLFSLLNFYQFLY